MEQPQKDTKREEVMKLADLFKQNITVSPTSRTEPKRQHIRDVQKDINKEELVKWAAKNWYQDDEVFVINRTGKTNESWLVAGSSALHDFLSFYNNGQQPAWTPNDTDIFMLTPSNGQGNEQNNGDDNKKQTRTKLLRRSVDIIEVNGKDHDMIARFDLAPCRVGTFGMDQYVISKQCLASILCGGLYVLPEYVRKYETFQEIAKKLPPVRSSDQDWLRHRWIQLTSRITKYERRGFTPIYINTNVLIPSLFHQPAYY